jgi:hypothetical protein
VAPNTSALNRPEFEWLARAGLVARGVVYGIVGIAALKLRSERAASPGHLEDG